MAKKFQFEEETCSAYANGKAVKVLSGPGIAGIAWFPFLAGLENLPDCELKTHPLAEANLMTGGAIPLVFQSGNHRPKTQTRGAEEFSRELALHDDRAALAVEQPKLHIDDQQRPCGFTFRHLAHVGYAPARLGLTTRHLMGIGSSGHEVRFDQNAAHLHYFVRFKVGWLADAGARLLTGHWAPFAVMAVHYSQWVNGKTRVHFHGSHVPSQSYYRDWNLCSEYSMLKCSSYEFDDFIEAGRGNDAKVFEIGDFAE